MLILFANRLPEMLNRICLMLGPSNCRLSLFWEAVLWPELAFLAFRLSVPWYISPVVSSYVRVCTSLVLRKKKEMCNAFISSSTCECFYLFSFYYCWWMRNAWCLCELKNGFESSEKWEDKVNETREIFN